MPSLRDRKDDIPELVDHFCGQICQEYNIPVKVIEPKAIKELQKPNWSGNIRELRNVVERLIILSKEKITLKDVKSYVSGVARPSTGLDKIIDKFDTLEQLQEYVAEMYKTRSQAAYA